jgi:hypothetical protein
MPCASRWPSPAGSERPPAASPWSCTPGTSDCSITDTHVSFTWKDRAHGNAIQTETVPGVEFVRRYLRHVLPAGLKAVRHYGFCHPAAKAKRERVAFHTGLPLLIGAAAQPAPVPPPSAGVPTCPCCGQPMKCVLRVPSSWRSPRGPPRTLATAL